MWQQYRPRGYWSPDMVRLANAMARAEWLNKIAKRRW
jgi:hypothetical protein